ncbi:zinc-dependent peptidase [Mesonia aquimarina]|uniref:zinc-dependent peptidase n=1 Tax=Mesonia aquimarina TaxID=1504967 RepID=UPI000EF61A9F|nr:zinc-dependent peptidase [Mesonia aquimarina]
MKILIIIFIVVLISCLLAVIISRSIILLDHLYLFIFKKPAFTHAVLGKVNRLSKKDQEFLIENFSFYNQLSADKKKFFEHRIISFISTKKFEGREQVVVTYEMKLWVAATAIMLTFGMRNYKLPMLEIILIYPDIYLSTVTKNYHKGEYNPYMRALVFSWKHFKEGYADSNDNLNLGIHEFIHLIQINSYKKNDISAVIFTDTSKELIRLLANPSIREKLLKEDYFRNYAYTNQLEFLAVLVEYFIESPTIFKQKFPDFYIKIRKMLNYNFVGY